MRNLVSTHVYFKLFLKVYDYCCFFFIHNFKVMINILKNKIMFFPFFF